MKLGIIIGSTRPGRSTDRQALWIKKTVEAKGELEATLVDLKDYPLPFFNEAISPRYNPDRTPAPEVQKWLDTIGSFDAYIFVTPEYNHSIPGELKNVFDYMTWEMVHKPAAIASHGTVGGARAAMHLKEILSEGQAVVIPKFSAISHMSDVISEEGVLDEAVAANPYGPQAQLDSLLGELTWYATALKAARDQE